MRREEEEEAESPSSLPPSSFDGTSRRLNLHGPANAWGDERGGRKSGYISPLSSSAV